MPTTNPSLVPLSSLNDEGQMIMPDFWAEIAGESYFITAVLERTVVYVDGTEKKLIRRDKVLVDPTIIEMRPVANTASWRSRGKVITSKAVAPVEPVAVAVVDEDVEVVIEVEDVEVVIEVEEEPEVEEEL